MNLRSVRPLGTFHARVTRDGEAQRRDGEAYFMLNELEGDARGGELVEIMFEDGMWMIATAADLDLS